MKNLLNITITVNLDGYDEKLREYCEKNQYDVPDYNTMMGRIEDDLLRLDGLNNIMFGHSSWVEFDLGTDDFEEAKYESEVVLNEIREVFAKHGIFA